MAELSIKQKTCRIHTISRCSDMLGAIEKTSDVSIRLHRWREVEHKPAVADSTSTITRQ